MKKIGSVLVLLLAIGGLVAIGFFFSKKSQTNSSDKLQVVATLFPLYDWTKQIGGEKVEVELLLTGGAGAHDVAFSPQAAIQLSQADVLVMNGAGLETYLDIDQLKTENPGLSVVKMDTVITNGIKLDEDEQEEYPLSQFNPHFWLSPKQAVKQAQLIQDTLIQLDPSNADYYKERGDAYIAELKKLDKTYTATTSTFSHKSFIAFHDAMPYTARDYGLTQVAVIEDFPGTSPSPEDIVNLHTIITQTGVSVIFTEPQFSSQVAQTLASDTGASLAEFDTLETANPEVDTYISKMTSNLENMKAVLL